MMGRPKISLRLAVFCALLFTSTGTGAGSPVKLVRKGDQVEIFIGGKLFTTYYFPTEVAKPYFRPLRSADGTILTRDFPEGNVIPLDHAKDRNLEPHQRDMYFGHGNLDGIDFWGEEVFSKFSEGSAFGRTVFRKLEAMQSGTSSGELRADFDLLSPHGRVIASEIQAFVFTGDADTRTVDCEFILMAPPHADLTLGDTKEGTFGIRLRRELNSPPARMVNSAGAEGEEAIWGKRADWVDYDGTVDGKDLGIAVFESPKSFRHPTYWHARTYGLLAANPFGRREFLHDPQQDGSWTIPQGKQLRFRYRVFIHQGDYREAKVGEAYQQYAALEQK